MAPSKTRSSMAAWTASRHRRTDQRDRGTAQSHQQQAASITTASRSPGQRLLDHPQDSPPPSTRCMAGEMRGHLLGRGAKRSGSANGRCEQVRPSSPAVAVAEGQAATTDGFLEAATPRADHEAAAGDPLQGDDAEGLIVARGDDQDPVRVEQAHDLFSLPAAQEVDLPLDPEPAQPEPPGPALGPVPDDR